MAIKFVHYGIVGMKWGVRRYQNKDGSLTNAGKLRRYALQNMQTAEVQNLKKFGKDREHNILYISGKSGSGKSTAALSMKDEDTDVIHLDSYFELRNINSRKNQNPNFNKFLREHSFSPSSLNNQQLFKDDIKEYFKKWMNLRNYLKSSDDILSISIAK